MTKPATTANRKRSTGKAPDVSQLVGVFADKSATPRQLAAAKRADAALLKKYLPAQAEQGRAA